MSRIGKAPISIPSGVEVSVSKGNVVTIKGTKGQLNQQIDPAMKVTVADNVLSVERPTETKRHRAIHGLSRALINNMVVGVSEGYKISQELIGVGFRAAVKGQILELSLGYSHNISFELPAEIKVSAESEKGKAPVVHFESCDKQLIGEVAAKVRSMRKPEPYKGKGVRYLGEQIRRKAGKSGAK